MVKDVNFPTLNGPSVYPLAVRHRWMRRVWCEELLDKVDYEFFRLFRAHLVNST